ncbi:MAG: LamG domain-containing protein [Kiritimatiellae bacterium]|nr:LamG domain-containing protein [Kiritimatiellia bacterium]
MKYLPWMMGILVFASLASFADQPSATNCLPRPVLHYTFQRYTGGNGIEDSSGRHHGGVVAGKLQLVEGPGKRDKAIRFDGRSSFIRVPRSDSLEPDAITVAAWIRIAEDANRVEPGVIVFKRNSSYHDNEDFALQIFPNHILRIDVSSPRSGHHKVDSSVALAPDVWHHAAMSIGGRGARLYLDGEMVGEGFFPCALDHFGGADLLIGARDHAALPTSWFGAYDLADLQIWAEALDGEQIARLYRKKARLPGVAHPGGNHPPAFPPERPGGAVGNPRIFPAWIDPNAKPEPDETRILAELRELLAQGRRDRAASPEYLNALQRLVDRHSGVPCRTGNGLE